MGTCRQVDKDIWLGLTSAFDQMNHRVKVAIEAAAGDDTVHIPRAIEFEVLDSVFRDHIETDVTEPSLILRSGKCEASIVRLESGFSASKNTEFLGLHVTTPGREPNSRFRAIFFSRFTGSREAVWESCVETPQG